ncbi:MAG: hypothetical protein B6I36_04375 [Desulfobacteraceae bacterium 4572_35.1]|nr:MAG: hypothetical protein B6I36_04375 [Desulfobacteraceae bacterium 4572_35.1]
MKTLDCRNMQCPQPVLETRKQLLASPNNAITVVVSNDIAQANVSRLAAKQGFEVAVSTNNDDISLILTPKGSIKAETSPSAKENNQVNGDTIVYISSNCMGSGSDELGEVLMRNFIFTLGESDELPSTILFVNSGVKLCCNNSSVLEPLQLLANKGVTICACGLCLEFFGLTDQLKTGRASNMLETLEAMQQAGRIIKP